MPTPKPYAVQERGGKPRRFATLPKARAHMRKIRSPYNQGDITLSKRIRGEDVVIGGA